MRRLVLPLLLLLAALAAVAPRAGARPPAPEPSALPAPPVLRGPASVAVAGPGRLVLTVRLARPVERRFDGELRATAVVDGRIASLQPLARRHAGSGACYTATVASRSDRPGRVVAVSVVLDGPPPTAVTTLVAVRPTRAGDGRDAPPPC
jgi:hypothetical protein